MFDFLTNAFSSLFSALSGKRFDESMLKQTLTKIKDTLLDADVPYELVQSFIDSLQNEVTVQSLSKAKNPADLLLKIVHTKLVAFLGEKAVLFEPKPGSVLMVLGLQGSGKTTTAAKLAQYCMKEASKKQKKVSVLLASVDYYRPAAIDQLEVLAEKCGAKFYRAHSTNPEEAAREIHEHYQLNRYDFLILDTAGRLHVDSHMMSELQNITGVVKPQHKILVLDAMTGQESLTVARSFDQSIGFEGAILTKADSDSRGGALFSFRYALKKPILFMGCGEKLTDLEQCNPVRMAGRLLGLGDLETLAQKAEEVEIGDQKRIAERFGTDSFTLADFAQQLEMMGKLGSLSTIAKYIPGLGGLKIDPAALEKGEKELRVFKAIINSMTVKERSQTSLLNNSRKDRIAKGAGVNVTDVNKLLQRFEEMRQYAKLMKKMGGFNGMFKGR